LSILIAYCSFKQTEKQPEKSFIFRNSLLVSSSKVHAVKGDRIFVFRYLRTIALRHSAPKRESATTPTASLEISPMLLFVHLLSPKQQKPSPQKTVELNQIPLSDHAHKQTVEHLNQVKANHLLERRLFL
jgi:hypothetical protein